MSNIYNEALQFIEQHPGCGASAGIAKLVLSLFDSGCAFSYRECIVELDSRNTSLAFDMVHNFTQFGETEELREVGRKIIALYPKLYKLGQGRYKAEVPTLEYTPVAAEQVLRRMFAKLGEAGWQPVKVFDGEKWEKTSTVEEALDVIDSVEESILKVKRGDVRHTIVLIPGNGEDVICDHSFVDGDPDGFAALMDSVCEES